MSRLAPIAARIPGEADGLTDRRDRRAACFLAVTDGVQAR